MNRMRRTKPKKLTVVSPVFWEPASEVQGFAHWLQARAPCEWTRVVSTVLLWQLLRESLVDAELRLGSGDPSLSVFTKRYGWLPASVVVLDPVDAGFDLSEQVVPLRELQASENDTDLVVVMQQGGTAIRGFEAGIIGWTMPRDGERTVWSIARKLRRSMPVTELLPWSQLIVYCLRAFTR